MTGGNGIAMAQKHSLFETEYAPEGCSAILFAIT
jgi:hypothetical protein